MAAGQHPDSGSAVRRQAGCRAASGLSNGTASGLDGGTAPLHSWIFASEWPTPPATTTARGGRNDGRNAAVRLLVAARAHGGSGGAGVRSGGPCTRTPATHRRPPPPVAPANIAEAGKHGPLTPAPTGWTPRSTRRTRWTAPGCKPPSCRCPRRTCGWGGRPIRVKAHGSGIARKVMGRVSGGQEAGCREVPEGRVRRRSCP